MTPEIELFRELMNSVGRKVSQISPAQSSRARHTSQRQVQHHRMTEAVHLPPVNGKREQHAARRNARHQAACQRRRRNRRELCPGHDEELQLSRGMPSVRQRQKGKKNKREYYSVGVFEIDRWDVRTPEPNLWAEPGSPSPLCRATRTAGDPDPRHPRNALEGTSLGIFPYNTQSPWRTVSRWQASLGFSSKMHCHRCAVLGI